MVKNSTSDRSPLSPTLWPADAFVWWRSLLLALAIGAVALAATLALGIVVVARFGVEGLKHPSAPVALAVQIGVYVPVLALLWFVLPRIAHRSLRDLGLRLPRPVDLGWGIGGAALMVATIEAVGAIEERALHLKISETAVDLLKSAHGPALAAFAVFAVVAAPFVEELIFRGFLLNAFRRYVPAPVAVLLSGALFGLAHGDPRSAAAVLPLAAGGLVLGAVYYRSGSLVSSMIAHGTFNLISVIGVIALHAS